MTLAAKQFREMRPDHFQVVADFGHGPDRASGGPNGVPLLNGDGRGNVLDPVDGWFVHPVEELAGVGGKRFDVAALSLGVEGFKGERTFAGTAEAGDDDELPERQIEVEVLEVVLPNAPKTDMG